MKETPEEILKKHLDSIFDELDDFATFESILSICKAYHSEMLKSSLPTEEEIKGKASDNAFDPDEIYIHGFKRGVYYLIELLTKK